MTRGTGDGGAASIESIAAGGDGVARVGGRVVFVPRAAPGDWGTIRVVPRGRFGHGEWVQLDVSSPDRVQPPCRHYTDDRCGGCQLQHLRYDAQLAAKARIVVDALRRIGGRAVEEPAVRASPRQWRYRQKLTLAMRRRVDAWTMGLHPYDDARAVFALDDCPITDERVIAVWRAVHGAAHHLPPGPELRGAVRLLEGGASFLVEGGRTWPARDAFFDAVPQLLGLWWAPAGKRRRRIAGRAGAQAGDASFAQVNPDTAALLHARVVELVASYAPAHVIDAYAGTGATAAALAGRGVHITAIEVDAEAARALGERLPPGSRAVTGRVEDHLARAFPADVVVLNPPRAGVAPRVCELLATAAVPPRAVVYVSCDPATLARDLTRLRRFEIKSLEAFDMFQQTAHVETVCELIAARA